MSLEYPFSVFLGMSEDGLTGWSNDVKLASGASQAKVWLNPDGPDILVAFES